MIAGRRIWRGQDGRVRPQLARPSRRRVCALFALVAVAAAGCSSGGGGDEFSLSFINVNPGQTWKINRPIRIGFSRPVDFSSVSLNTISIRRQGGAPTSGEFYMESPTVVVFQPRCPLQDDYSDAGLLPGGVVYELSVFGADATSSLTVRSVDGVSLASGDSRNFSTPDSSLQADLFFDAALLSPVPVLRGNAPEDDAVVKASHVEVGGSAQTRVYFERDPSSGAITLDPPGPLPLNKLGDPSSQVSLLLFLNQPVDAGAANISSERLDWQFEDQPGHWSSLTTDVVLEANCSLTGAVVRITPLGILPPGTNLRVVVAPEFSDIVGETNPLQQTDFAPASTEAAPTPLADHYLEEFLDDERSDDAVALADPLAEWGEGRLRASFAFTGTGGPEGNFDWRVPAGQTFFFSTNYQIITGGPNFSNSALVTVVGGVLDLRNMRVETGATLVITGTNPLVIQASGTVEIDGKLILSGSNSPGVTSFNTANNPEPGAPGQAGGGAGGIGSPLTTASSPRGGTGRGAFNQPNGGGQGGELGWTNVGSAFDYRRGAGGGGGSLGPDQPQILGSLSQYGDWDQSFIGLDAESGFANTHPNANGATSGSAGPFGGPPGITPFSDGDPQNDFFGVAVDLATGAIIEGELEKPWAGAGGGGGGDASYVGVGGTFPNTTFSPGGDEKGAGGGGGGGSLHVLALEDIVFGPDGLIVARGGMGGGGENTGAVNRVGGGSGGGSGGHVILEVAGVIDMSQSQGPSSTPGKLLGGILATGGQGGVGKLNKGGATTGGSGQVETQPHLDACPPILGSGQPYPTSGPNACRGHIDGCGGDGGPGIIQLHAPSLAAIHLPSGLTLADLCKPNPRFFTVSTAPAWTAKLTPSFGRKSRSRSTWIPLGEGGFDPGSSSTKDVQFEFGGIDPVTGLVRTTSGVVDPLPPILGPDTLLDSGVPSITSAFTLVLDAGALVGGPHQVLLDSPVLLDRYLLKLSSPASLSDSFDVIAASYDPLASTLHLTVDSGGSPLDAHHGPGSSVELQPAFFRISSNDFVDFLPDSATVAFQFQITKADLLNGNQPDPGATYPPNGVFTSDPDELNSLPDVSEYRYFRFEALFDIDALGTALSPASPIPAVDFLRIPYRFE